MGSEIIRRVKEFNQELSEGYNYHIGRNLLAMPPASIDMAKSILLYREGNEALAWVYAISAFALMSGIFADSVWTGRELKREGKP